MKIPASEVTITVVYEIDCKVCGEAVYPDDRVLTRSEAHHHAVPLDGDNGYCAVCRTRITRVRAYVKGPDGLPLKAVPETVYRVAR